MRREPEDRRLKAVGIALLALSVPIFLWLSADAVNQWPPHVQLLGRFMGVAALALNLAALGLMWLVAGCGGARPWATPKSRRAWAFKFAAANLILPMLVYGLLTDSGPAAAELERSDWGIGVSLVLLLMMAGASALYRRSRRHEASSAAQAMADDPRPPVLYLRSFQDDGRMLVNDFGLPWLQRVAVAFKPTSAEEELAATLERIGPVVAIGKPGEPLPELGAARLYVGHDVWQAEVSALMRRAALVVVRIGASPGVLWEIGQALECLPRQRLVLVLLGGAPLAPPVADRLAAVLGDALPAALPEPVRWRPLAIRPDGQRIGALVCFDAAGRPQVLQVHAWRPGLQDLVFAMTLRPSAGPMRRAWRRVFDVIGQPWGVGPRHNQRLRAVLLAFFFGWFGAHWFYLGRHRRGWLYLLLFPVGVSIIMMWVDALRFLWVDRAEFDARFAAAPR